MLTKQDLNAIGKLTKKIIRDEIESEGRNIKDEITSDISSLKIRIFTEFIEAKDRLKNLEIRLTSVEKMIKKIAEKLETAINIFSHLDVDLRKRVKNVEEYLKLDSN